MELKHKYITDNYLVSLLGYYNGTPFKYTDETGITYGTCDIFLSYFMCGNDYKGNHYEIEDPYEGGKLQLILRDPLDCNAKQKQKLKELYHKVIDTNKTVLYYADTPLSLDYAFKNSIDMFELIERGLAVDIITLPEELKHWAINEHEKKFNKFA